MPIPHSLDSEDPSKASERLKASYFANNEETTEEERSGSDPEIAFYAIGLLRDFWGTFEEEIIRIRFKELASLLQIGAHLSIANVTASLAEAQECQGAISDALETVEQALKVHPLGRPPETLRLRGELRLKQGQMELAEVDFREAIALAQKRCAKAWELRATMSLARLLVTQGRRDEARTMLTEIYNWFTEGFDTRDLLDAKALLDELNQ